MRLPSVKAPEIKIEGPTELYRKGTWRDDWMTSAQDRAAIIWLLRSVNAQDVVEIGVHEGYTAACVLENVHTVKKYRGVDVLPGYVTKLSEQQNEIAACPGQVVLHDRRFELMLSSRGSLDIDLDDCDAMIIDGDHSRLGVMSDTVLARRYVRKGGIVIWHDCCEAWDNEVKIVLEEMVVHGRPIQHVHDTRIAFERL